MSGPSADAARPSARAARAPAALPAWTWIALLGVAPLVAGGLALAFGKDFSWDFRNYHYYNAHAFWVGRSADIAPAQLQTYYNPVLDLPMYALVQTLPARAVGFALGCVQGLNFALVFALFWQVARVTSPTARLIAAFAASLAAFAAPASLVELGTGTGDNLVSLFVLASLLAAVPAVRADAEPATARRRLMIAGLLMGVAVGLKQTAVCFALGGALALACAVRPRRRAVARVAVFGLAGAVGALALSGHWLWAMWREFHNPLFPYFNQIFRSPAIAPSRFVNDVFFPRALWEYLVWPLVFAADSKRVSYYRFTDVRFAVLYLALVGYGAQRVWQAVSGRRATPRPAGSGAFDRASGDLLLGFAAFSFLVWMLLFSLYRYMLSLELLVPLVFLIALDRLDLRRWPVRIAGAAAALAVFAAFSLQIPERRPWTARWTDPQLAFDRTRFDPAPGSLVVMLGGYPMAYLIPQLPAQVSWVRPFGNLELGPDHGLFREIVERIRDAEGDLFVVHGSRDRPAAVRAQARAVGLGFAPDGCVALRLVPRDRITVCRATRTDG